LFAALTAVCGSTSFASDEKPLPVFKKLVLSDKFYAEGAYYADFNRDGHMDVVAGPYWWEGPGFMKKHEIRPPKEFDPHGYSDNFLTYTGDFNGDGWPDVFYVPFPGTEAYWYENPGSEGGPWKKHFALKDCGNESPQLVDLFKMGQPVLIYNNTGHLGYASFNPAKPDEPWTFHAVSAAGNYQRFTHGIGYGDINGDGRNDIIESKGWWEQPAQLTEGNPSKDKQWIWHPFKFAENAAQMYVYDVDGDGLADVICSWHCHQYGLVWYKQIRSSSGEITWKQNVILPPKPDLKSSELRFSQLHGVALADMTGNGLKDIITGKRYWAHGPTGDVEPSAPAVLYWFELIRDKDHGAHYVPHLIDSDSGVGTQVSAIDLNGDGVPDVIVGNKKGVFVFLSQK
jgi:hypothetical protein